MTYIWNFTFCLYSGGGRLTGKIRPFLIPVENAISAWEAAVKRQIRNNMLNFMQPPNVVLAGRTQIQFRRDTLEQIAHNTNKHDYRRAMCSVV